MLIFFFGVGKHTQFQEVILRLPQGIYCLQETKSTHTDILKLSHSHIYLSGSPDDSHAGVGFAIPTPLLPIVYIISIPGILESQFLSL